MSERELLLACVAFLKRISHEEAGDKLRLADKLRAALADRPEQQPVAWFKEPARFCMSIESDASMLADGWQPLYAAPVARPEPAQPVAHILDEVKRLANAIERGVRHGEGFNEAKAELLDVVRAALNAPSSHPAPSAYVFSAHDQEILKDIEAMQHKDGWWERALAVGALRIIRSLAASHPAPSEAAPERQEKCSSAKNPLYCWNVRCQLSKTCIRAAQPAKGDAS